VIRKIGGWIVVVALIVIAAAIGWYWYRPAISTINPAHESRAADDLASVENKDTAIRGLATKIAELRDLADRERAARLAAEHKAGTFADRARLLSLEVQRLEAVTKGMPMIGSRLQALERLKALGYR